MNAQPKTPVIDPEFQALIAPLAAPEERDAPPLDLAAGLSKVDVHELAVESIIFREDLYPRIERSPITVQKYAEDLEVLPPIEVNQHYELIDGWHRWTAHRKREAATIRATITPTASNEELLELAIERNATHGLQLSQEDKRDMARRIYLSTPMEKQGPKKQRLARILSVSERTVREWLSRIDKDAKEARNKRIFEMWLACWTQEEIAERVGLSQPQVKEVLSESAILPESMKPAAAHLTDFDPPIYNIWRQQEKTAGVSHYGNSEVRWVDNLLYLYTQPFDIVVDPFGGGGSTIDICRKRLRRYWVSDRKPVVEREGEIRQHDMTTGLPRLPRWSDVKLVYLDPPYWKQAEGQYSDDPEDLANMPLEKFHSTLAKVINAFAKKLKPGAVIALMIQPTQWNASEHAYTDHVLAALRAVDLPLDMRYSVPYESQQYNAQMVEWAKANRRCLVLTREIVVWRVE
jgi:transcriptional regulator with XRE-family HTH domain